MSEQAATQHHRVRFLTPGTLVLISIMVIGYGFGLVRMIAGIGAVTNLTDDYPWGIWIAIDVACGVALAAGGFTTAALVNIFGKKQFEALERPALLTAWLGYTFVGAGLLFDLGRYYNIWHPAVYWQGNSVLFEVGMCVMFYLSVLTVEFAPTLLGGLMEHIRRGYWWTGPLKRFEGFMRRLRLVVRRVLPIFIIAGVVLSFMHQSSLGTLLLIAPTKVSPLWWTPIMPLLFLLSAIMVGFPVVIFEGFIAAKAFKRQPEMHLLGPLAGYIPITLGLYAVVKFGDLFYRHDLSIFTVNARQTIAFLLEVGIGIIIPFVMLVQKRVRHSPRGLFVAVTLVIGGLVLNRINVFLVSYQPRFATGGYFPSIGEISVTAALVATIIFLYRFFATYFPVLPSEEEDPVEREIRFQAREKTGLWGWIARAAAVLLLLGFIDVYTYVHQSAVKASRPPSVSKVLNGSMMRDRPASRPAKRKKRASFDPNKMPSLIRLHSALAASQQDRYEPARFLHRDHAIFADGDCTKCHHRTPKDAKDRRGTRLRFGELKQHKPVKCSHCHRKRATAKLPNSPGLRGAYHQRCIGCHRKLTKRAPTGCTPGCHRARVPDHQALIVHYKKTKPSRVTKATCTSCHRKMATGAKLDCLSCHHEKKDQIEISYPSPARCMSCHTRKIGNLTAVLAKPKAAIDVHMGRAKMSCQSCHTGESHEPAGRCIYRKRTRSKVSCTKCHASNPHRFSRLLGAHLDRHSRSIACQSCHVGRAKDKTITFDWSRSDVASKRATHLDPNARIHPFERGDQRKRARLDHQVRTKKQALRCADCHSQRAVSCTRCHTKADYDTFHPTEDGPCQQCHGKPKTQTTLMAFDKLGYKGDPAIVGGRFRSFPTFGKTASPPASAPASQPGAKSAPSPREPPKQYQDGLIDK
jgi:Ni/Fe-hydrogenase subunit HybB-like protein